MDATRLIEGYKSIMRAIYSPGEYYSARLDCLERVVAGALRTRLSSVASDVMTLFRIVLALGVRDREWRVLAPLPRLYEASRKCGMSGWPRWAITFAS